MPNKAILLNHVMLFLFSLFLMISCVSQSESQSEDPVRIIFDTDFGGDADDLGALAMLNHFHNKGECELVSVMCWNTEKYSVSAVDAVNTFYGNPDIPIGRRTGSAEILDWNHSRVITEKHSFDATTDNVPEATQLYRKLLSESIDQSILIVTVGPLMNIKKLIDSKADQYSSLSGRELIEAKVKEFVIMGGQFPSGENEWNFDGDMPGVTRYVLNRIDVPITFSGFELGESLRTGIVFNDLPKDSPLYLGFLHFSEHAPWIKDRFEGKILDNATFDQTAVLYAVRNGVGNYWRKVEGGYCEADDSGGNRWVPKVDSNHSYLVLIKDKSEMQKELEALMLGEF